MPEGGLDEFTSWRCARDNAKFCPAEGCPAHFGCARDQGWLPGMPTPAECLGIKVRAAADKVREDARVDPADLHKPI